MGISSQTNTYNNGSEMPGERNLEVLLGAMAPALDTEELVFCTAAEIAGEPVCAVREDEGWTLVLRREEAERLGLAGAFPCRRITLTVHSSLDAVGLLARVAAHLAEAGISVNVMSGYYHDHLFVPADRAEEALDVLLKTARRNRR
jgi:hypothetical protein